MCVGCKIENDTFANNYRYWLSVRKKAETRKSEIRIGVWVRWNREKDFPDRLSKWGKFYRNVFNTWSVYAYMCGGTKLVTSFCSVDCTRTRTRELALGYSWWFSTRFMLIKCLLYCFWGKSHAMIASSPKNTDFLHKKISHVVLKQCFLMHR